MTIKELKRCIDKQIEQGNGEKHILLSNDDEGNGYHAMYFAFTPIEDLLEYSDWENGYVRDAIPNDMNIKDFIVLG